MEKNKTQNILKNNQLVPKTITKNSKDHVIKNITLNDNLISRYLEYYFHLFSKSDKNFKVIYPKKYCGIFVTSFKKRIIITKTQDKIIFIKNYEKI